jgi:hypothetical protein
MFSRLLHYRMAIGQKLLETRTSTINYRHILLYVLLLLVGITIAKLHYTFVTSTTMINESTMRIDMKGKSSYERNLILSVAIDLPLLNIYRFTRTARSSCNYCYIVIFTNNVDSTDYKELGELYNVTFLSYEEHTPAELKSISLYSLRFITYHRYLLKNHYDNIFICDLRDVLFQHNIFDHLKAYTNVQLYAFIESEQLSIGGCQVHRNWLIHCYGENVFQNLYNESRSCAGTILGTYKGMICIYFT